MDQKVVQLAEQLNNANTRLDHTIRAMDVEQRNLSKLAEELGSSAAKNADFDVAGASTEAARVAGALAVAMAALEAARAVMTPAQDFIDKLLPAPIQRG